MSLILNTRAARGLETSINRRRRKPLKCRLGFHKWVALNDASEEDVPSTYPPDRPIDYISPKRQCECCKRIEWFVGPEVCGGKKPRWVQGPLSCTHMGTDDCPRCAPEVLDCIADAAVAIRNFGLSTEQAISNIREFSKNLHEVDFVDACPGPGGIAGRTAPAADFDGPYVSDGCDHEGFPGGCERAGHTPESHNSTAADDGVSYPQVEDDQQ